VRVVRENRNGHWNYREQKYETEKVTNTKATWMPTRFVATSTRPEHDELKHEYYSRYRDLSYAALLH